jgi:Calcium binding
MAKGRKGRQGPDRERLKELIDEAIVDCYDEFEQATGLFVKIEDNVRLPFRTRVLGAEVAVVALEQDDRGGIAAVCEREGERQRIALTDLPLPSSPPEGAEWIAAYHHWARHGWSDEDDEDDEGASS